ncbi:MAG: gliding motility-associated C-terminal domain-containing protein [Ekhidna sp.]
MLYRILIFTILLCPFRIDGQVISKEGRFSVEFDRGCIPMTVNITELDTFGTDVTRQYQYEENITNNKFHTYTSAGNYRIIQTSKGSLRDTIDIEVFNSFLPKVEFERCSGNEILVTSMENDYDFIRVYFSESDSTQLFKDESSSFAFSSESLQSIKLKGFFNNADNKCSDYFESIEPLPQLPVPSINSLSIKESCTDIFNLYLELDSIDSLTTYQIELSQISTSILLEGKLKEKEIILPNISFDKSLTEYCIQVNALDPCNSSKVDGSPICQQSSSLSLSPFEVLYSSYEENGILINIENTTSGSFNVFRRRESENFQLEDSVTSSYVDAIGSVSRKYFYKLDYIDSCEQILFTAETNPPFIEAAKNSKNSYSVKYTLPSPLPDGDYILEFIAGNNEINTKEQFNIVNSNGLPNPSEFELKLDAKDGTSSQVLTSKLYTSAGEFLRQSNSINLKFEIEIYVPTAFTPNNDGINDTLELFGLPSSEASIAIYSKWGHLIYSSDTPTPGWDGIVNGKLAPEGTYLYEIIFKATNGEKIRQKGTFALITN